MRRKEAPLSKKNSKTDEYCHINQSREMNIEIEQKKEKLKDSIEYNKRIGEDIGVIEDDQRKLNLEHRSKLAKIKNQMKEKQKLTKEVHEKVVKLTEIDSFAVGSRSLFQAREEKRNILRFVHAFFLFDKEKNSVEHRNDKVEKYNKFLLNEQRMLEKQIDMLREIVGDSSFPEKKEQIEKITKQTEKLNKKIKNSA